MYKKKIISVLIAITGLIIIGVSIITFLGFFKKQNAGILVDSNVDSLVYINDLQVGKTPYESEGPEGEIKLGIKPNTASNNLDDYETKVNLVSGIKTIVKREFNEDDDYSGLSVLSFEKTGNEDSYVTTVSNPDKSQIIIDGKIYGYTPVRISIPAGDHELIVKKESYVDSVLPIKVYKGFNLTVSVKLPKNMQSQAEVVVEEENRRVDQIRIDKNDAGFLRVRSGASTGFPEVGQVKPDEVYDILEEGEHGKWYKIKFGEVEGWVSGEFVTKL